VIGKRVALLPHLDAWMKGNRYGTVETYNRRTELFGVRLDVSGKLLRLRHQLDFEVIE
jgi:hypothetical protein